MSVAEVVTAAGNLEILNSTGKNVLLTDESHQHEDVMQILKQGRESIVAYFTVELVINEGGKMTN